MNDYSRAPRVLVVEDDEDIAQALQRSLRMEGYEVRSVADGEAALEAEGEPRLLHTIRGAGYVLRA